MINVSSQYFARDGGDVVEALASEVGVTDGSGAVVFESGRVRRPCGVREKAIPPMSLPHG